MLLALLLAGGLSYQATAPKPQAEITTTEQLLEAMKERYASKWYRYMTFWQYNYHAEGSGRTDTTIWHEAVDFKQGLFRIDTEGKANMLFTPRVFYVTGKGESQPAIEEERANPTMLLHGMFAYYSVAELLELMAFAGVDTGVFSEITNKDGEAYYIIGAKPGEKKATYYLVEKERLILTDMHEWDAQQEREVQLSFTAWEEYKGAWFEVEVEVYIDNVLFKHEVYHDICFPESLPEQLFLPSTLGITKVEEHHCEAPYVD